MIDEAIVERIRLQYREEALKAIKDAEEKGYSRAMEELQETIAASKNELKLWKAVASVYGIDINSPLHGQTTKSDLQPLIQFIMETVYRKSKQELEGINADITPQLKEIFLQITKDFTREIPNLNIVKNDLNTKSSSSSFLRKQKTTDKIPKKFLAAYVVIISISGTKENQQSGFLGLKSTFISYSIETKIIRIEHGQSQICKSFQQYRRHKEFQQLCIDLQRSFPYLSLTSLPTITRVDRLTKPSSSSSYDESGIDSKVYLERKAVGRKYQLELWLQLICMNTTVTRYSMELSKFLSDESGPLFIDSHNSKSLNKTSSSSQLQSVDTTRIGVATNPNSLFPRPRNDLLQIFRDSEFLNPSGSDRESVYKYFTDPDLKKTNTMSSSTSTDFTLNSYRNKSVDVWMHSPSRNDMLRRLLIERLNSLTRRLNQLSPVMSGLFDSARRWRLSITNIGYGYLDAAAAGITNIVFFERSRGNDIELKSWRYLQQTLRQTSRQWLNMGTNLQNILVDPTEFLGPHRLTSFLNTVDVVKGALLSPSSNESYLLIRQAKAVTLLEADWMTSDTGSACLLLKCLHQTSVELSMKHASLASEWQTLVDLLKQDKSSSTSSSHSNPSQNHDNIVNKKWIHLFQDLQSSQPLQPPSDSEITWIDILDNVIHLSQNSGGQTEEWGPDSDYWTAVAINPSHSDQSSPGLQSLPTHEEEDSNSNSNNIEDNSSIISDGSEKIFGKSNIENFQGSNQETSKQNQTILNSSKSIPQGIDVFISSINQFSSKVNNLPTSVSPGEDVTEDYEDYDSDTDYFHYRSPVFEMNDSQHIPTKIPHDIGYHNEDLNEVSDSVNDENSVDSEKVSDGDDASEDDQENDDVENLSDTPMNRAYLSKLESIKINRATVAANQQHSIESRQEKRLGRIKKARSGSNQNTASAYRRTKLPSGSDLPHDINESSSPPFVDKRNDKRTTDSQSKLKRSNDVNSNLSYNQNNIDSTTWQMPPRRPEFSTDSKTPQTQKSNEQVKSSSKVVNERLNMFDPKPPGYRSTPTSTKDSSSNKSNTNPHTPPINSSNTQNFKTHTSETPSNSSKAHSKTNESFEKTTASNEDLPPGWKTVRTDDGRVYYYHVETRESRWDKPMESAESSKSNIPEPKKKNVPKSNPSDDMKVMLREKVIKWRKKPNGEAKHVTDLISTAHEIITFIPSQIHDSSVHLTLSSPPVQVKKEYMKLVRQIHPDKLARDCPNDQKVLAEAVFVVVSESFDSYRKSHGI